MQVSYMTWYPWQAQQPISLNINRVAACIWLGWLIRFSYTHKYLACHGNYTVWRIKKIKLIDSEHRAEVCIKKPSAT